MLRDALFARGAAPAGGTAHGKEVSRLEGFSDAVFGFAITLLVVSLEVPRSFDQLVEALQGVPAFAASFAALVGIWYEHYRFFRQWDLEDGTLTALNAALLFVVLVYVYPLKFLASFLITGQLLGWRSGLDPDPIRGVQANALMIVYSTGFLMVFLMFTLMALHVYLGRGRLGLTPELALDARRWMESNLINVVVAAVSIALAARGGAVDAALAGWTYMALGPVHALYGAHAGRRQRRLLEAAG